MKTVFIVALIVTLVATESENGARNQEKEVSIKGKVHKGKVREKKNKALALEFYQKLFGDKDFSSIDKYLSDNYTQHNPDVADGKEGLRKFAKEFLKNDPKKKLDIKRIGADGDLVWIHLKNNVTGKDTAFVDIFRVKDGKIVEHWDVIQEVPATSLNNNTMF